MSSGDARSPRDVDPVTFEIIRHKLYSVMDETIIALENVSGSPITNEGHDLMASLYKADGGLMVGGVGFLHHLTSAAQAVKHILATYSEDPGINEDDVYFLNDSYTAALHPPDVYLISPIHFEGRLTGFVANFVHVTDIGAIDPGGFSPSARDNYQEGFQSKGLKIVERGRMRRDVLDTFLNMVRDPGMTQLDLKSQLAANHVAKQRMRDALRGLRRRRGRGGLRRADPASRSSSSGNGSRELPDGEWRAREYIDMPGANAKVELTAIKEGDTLTYDFTGSSPQVELGVNCSLLGDLGRPLRADLPAARLGRDLERGRDAADQAGRAGGDGRQLHPAGADLDRHGRDDPDRQQPLDARALEDVRRERALRATARPRSGTAATPTSRRTASTAEGEFFVAPLTDTFCGAGGARAFRDGVDMGGEIPNIVSRWANVESQELNTPIRYLFRRAVPDSGGPGKYRGGVCHEYAFTPNGTRGPMGLVLFGKGTRAPMSLGLFGGYPGCNVGYSTFRGGERRRAARRGLDDAARRAARGPVLGPRSSSSTGDVQYVRFMGGGGYGDPIDRDPALVAADVAPGSSREGAAREIYGVVVDGRRGRRRGDAVRGGAEMRAGAARAASRRRRPSAPRSPPPACGSPSTCSERAGGATQCTLVRDGGRPGRSGLEGATPSCGACPVERAGPLRTARRRVLPDRGVLPRLRHAARHRARGRRRPAAPRPRRALAGGVIRHEDIPGVFNLASWFLDRNLEEGRGDRVALSAASETVTYAELAR